jgi:hypothetical protein
MNNFDKNKVKETLEALERLCLHCKKCEEKKCAVYNAYGEIEKLK